MSDAAIRGQDSRVWVLLESGSNQDFIFQSTRRRFQVGASALLKDMPVWVDEGLRAVTGQAPSYVDEGIDRGPGVVRVVATSSKALLLAEDPEQGKALVAAVTAVALERAPGLDVWGYVEDVESALLAPPIDRLGDVHAAHANLRWTRPTPKQRFPLHPFLESCPVTGLPAATLDRDPAEQDGKLRPVSEPAAVVLARANAEVKRLTDVYGSAVLQDLTEDVRNAGWVAVVHADGNSVGELIPNLVSVNELAQFSRELERATRDAFGAAVATIGDRTEWLVPLILGGDDVTFVCDGRVALEITRAFLREFERQTGSRDAVAEPASRVLGRRYLTAAAGIAFVKPHYPFHAAYGLAEDLIDNAKRAKELAPGRSSYDFHVLHDSVARPLSDIRSHLRVSHPTTTAAGDLHLWPGPFLAPTSAPPSNPTSWESAHEDAVLLSGLATLSLPRDEQVLGSSAAHDLRVALLAGGQAITRTATRLQARSKRPAELRDFLIDQLHGDDGSIPFSRLLATLDAADMAAGVASGERVRPAPAGHVREGAGSV